MKKFITLCLLMAISQVGTAQNGLPKNLRFGHLFISNGLPEGTVTSLIQDKEGYIWIGTQKGLVRYDGYTPRIYMPGTFMPPVLIISKLYLDSEDRLWVGEYNTGLCLYDRANDKFVQYLLDSSNTNYLAAPGAMPFISDILDDQKGNLWITTDNWLGASNVEWTNTLYKFNIKTKKVERFGKNVQKDHYVNASRFNNLFRDKDGNIWVSADNGLYKYDTQTDRFTLHPTPSGSNQKLRFNQIYHDASQPNILWFTNGGNKLIYKSNLSFGIGLCRYDVDKDSFNVFLHQPGNISSIANDTVYAVIRARSGQLWVGTGDGISLFNPSTHQFTNYLLHDGKSAAIKELKEDRNGNLWCASSEGLVFFNTYSRKFERINSSEIQNSFLFYNPTHHLLIDTRGTLWFGNAQEGLLWIDHNRSRFVQYSDNPKLPNYFPGGKINSLAKAFDGTIWMGTSRGLYYWLPGNHTFSEAKINGKDIPTQTVIAGSKGYIWLGNLKGLYRYDPKTGNSKHFQNDNNDEASLSNNNVLTLLEDHLGNLWVGTYGGGLCRFNPVSQNFIRYPYLKNMEIGKANQPGTDNSEINALFEDKNGTVWLGCNTYGSLDSVNRETGTFTSYARSPGFNAVMGIQEDPQGRLWVGTFISGIFCLDQKRNSVTNYGQKEGLLYDRVSGILIDKMGKLWLPSARGISILNPQTNKVQTITKADGLPSENLYWAFKINDSLFLFSTDNGFFTLNPHDFAIDSVPPVIHIQSVHFINPGNEFPKDSSVTAFGKNEISLSYRDNRITFNYVGIYFQNASAIKYAYKLDGYDNSWLEAGTNRTVTYTNLSPGTYTFRVKAANKDGIWSKEDTITVVIRSPWWQTWWAYIMYALLFVAFVRGFINYRSRNLKRRNQLLERKVSQRTDELKHSLDNLKSTQSQLIQSEKMASLGELTAGIAHEIQNPLNFVNNFSDINTELIGEADQEIDKGNVAEVKDILNDIRANEEKINHHGKRADAIVKGMLQHSRTSTGQKEPTDINALCDEYLRLAYHGMRAKDKSFNCTMKTEFDPMLPKINVVPQDIGRVILNLINNAFYACERKNLEGFENLQGLTPYLPSVTVSTKSLGDKVEISVKDNGNGIPEKIKDKIFQPFFTTKPTGQGTGLGLSLSYDIVKAHGGEIRVETREVEARPDDTAGRGTEFVVMLPV
ncbi:MAG: ATP-binding protein [Chitinophagaceae bacterium]|nr:ATP-binding protein [Chitinophagaceae bacterium]